MLDARIPDGLNDIRQGWTLDDLVHAHEFIDELDVIAVADAERARAAARGGQP